MKLYISLLLCSFLTFNCFSANYTSPLRDTVAVISINDFHGAFLENRKQAIPGAANLIYCVDSLRKRYPTNIVVSAGDNFGGSYFSLLTKGSLLPELFQRLEISISAVGNHEFDYGLEYLKDKWSEYRTKQDWKFNYLACNIVEKATNTAPLWCQPTYLVDVMLPNAQKNISVAFAGLSPESTPNQTSTDLSDFLFAGNYVEKVRSVDSDPLVKNADIKLLLTHIGTIVDKQTQQIKWMTGDTGAERLPQLTNNGYIGLFSGHSHERVCGAIDGLPLVQGAISARYVSILKIVLKDGKMESVIPEVVKVNFQQNLPDYELSNHIAQVVEKEKLQNVVARSQDDLIHERSDKLKITALGSNVCAAYRMAFDSLQLIPVVGLSHFGGIRASLYKGDIRKIDAAEVLPFFPPLVYAHVKGRILRNILEVGLNNTNYGFIQANNLNIEYYNTPYGKRIETIVYKYENKREIIEEDETYTIVADSYLTQGKDSYPAFLFNSVKQLNKKATDVFINYLEKLTAQGVPLKNDTLQKQITRIILQPAETAKEPIFLNLSRVLCDVLWLSQQLNMSTKKSTADFKFVYDKIKEAADNSFQLAELAHELMSVDPQKEPLQADLLLEELCFKIPANITSKDSIDILQSKCVEIINNDYYFPYDLPLKLHAYAIKILLDQYTQKKNDTFGDLKIYLNRWKQRWIEEVPKERLSKVSEKVLSRKIELTPKISIMEYYYIDENNVEHTFIKRQGDISPEKICADSLARYRDQIIDEQTYKLKSTYTYNMVYNLYNNL